MFTVTAIRRSIPLCLLGLILSGCGSVEPTKSPQPYGGTPVPASTGTQTTTTQTSGNATPAPAVAAKELPLCPDPTDESDIPPEFDITKPTYEGHARAIIETSCVACHSATSAIRQRPFLDTYDGLRLGLTAALNRMRLGTMPPVASGKRLVTPTEQGLLLLWRDQGLARGVAATPVPLPPEPAKPETPVVSYTSDISKLMAARCTTCHRPGVTSPDLSTFAALSQRSAASLARIQAGTMPPGGKLPAGEITLFSQWIAAGAPEASGATPPPAVADCRPK